MPRAARTVTRAGAVLLLATTLTRAGHADPDPCSARATVSPCFDADPLWISAGSSPFPSLGAARTLEPRDVSLVAAITTLERPVLLVAASPHPEGREVPVLDFTSTLTLGARYGLGRGLDASLSLPLVLYQHGTGAEGVTSQRSSSVTPTTVRDPRLGLWTAVLGRSHETPVALSTRLEVALPLGDAFALAGGKGPTVAPGAVVELREGRFTAALDAGFRLRRAVSFGTVREGSELTLGAGLAGRLLEEPALALAVEASLRAGLAAPPVGAKTGERDLPAEWLASLRFSPHADSTFSAALGMGSGLPLSRTEGAGGSASVLGVTAPKLRAILLIRYLFSGRSRAR